MTAARKTHKKPPIKVGETDFDRLSRLVDTFAQRSPEVADDLAMELDRASVVADDKLSGDVVRMGSTLRYVTDTGEDRTVALVYPADADIAAGKVSVMTPIGVALIGLTTGQSIDWEARDGRVHRLTIKSVSP